MSRTHEKLALVQHRLKAPKSQYNSFGKYSYRSCEDILEGLKRPLENVGALVLLRDEIVEIGGRIYVKATAAFVDAESGEAVEVTAMAREAEQKKGMDESQITGTASSYARKYALNGLFAIDDAKDADTDEHQRQGGRGGSSSQSGARKSQSGAKPSQPQGGASGVLGKEGARDILTAIRAEAPSNDLADLSFMNAVAELGYSDRPAEVPKAKAEALRAQALKNLDALVAGA